MPTPADHSTDPSTDRDSAPSARPPRRVLVVGCGLIGGSIAGATTHVGDRVWAIDRDATLRAALQRGLIERGIGLDSLGPWPEVLAEFEPNLIVLAASPDAIERQLPDIAAASRCSTEPPIVCDVASVKQPIVALAQDLGCPRFIGGHPMAGSERSGVEAADPALLQGRRFVLCPSSTAGPRDLPWLSDWVRDLRAEPVEMTARTHDRAVAMVSHLPHLAALTLMKTGKEMESEFEDADTLWSLAAGSWRDATRVAAASPALWRSIVEANRAPILDVLDRWLRILTQLRADLDREGGRAFDRLEPDELAELRRSIAPWLPPSS